MTEEFVNVHELIFGRGDCGEQVITDTRNAPQSKTLSCSLQILSNSDSAWHSDTQLLAELEAYLTFDILIIYSFNKYLLNFTLCENPSQMLRM